MPFDRGYFRPTVMPHGDPGRNSGELMPQCSSSPVEFAAQDGMAGQFRLIQTKINRAIKNLRSETTTDEWLDKEPVIRFGFGDTQDEAAEAFLVGIKSR